MSDAVAVRLTGLEARIEILERELVALEAACRRKDKLLADAVSALLDDATSLRWLVKDEIDRR